MYLPRVLFRLCVRCDKGSCAIHVRIPATSSYYSRVWILRAYSSARVLYYSSSSTAVRTLARSMHIIFTFIFIFINIAY